MQRINSPRTDDSAIEQEIQAKGLTAPRVTPADIEANIASEHYINALEGVLNDQCLNPTGKLKDVSEAPADLSVLTFCILVLRNGFTVTGESACASPENFDAELGRKIARQAAVNKLWPLMGYALKERLHSLKVRSGDTTAVPNLWHLPPHAQRVFLEKRELDDKLKKLAEFAQEGNAIFCTLDEDERLRLKAQLHYMEAYSSVLQDRINNFR